MPTVTHWGLGGGSALVTSQERTPRSPEPGPLLGIAPQTPGNHERALPGIISPEGGPGSPELGVTVRSKAAFEGLGAL